MSRIFKTIIILLFLQPLFAEPVFFGGLQGDFFLPSHFNTAKQIGKGFGVSLEGGVQLNNISLALLAGYASSNEGSADDALVKSLNETMLGIEAGYAIGQNTLQFLPEWLAIRPNIAAIADFYNADGYRSKSKKIMDQKETSTGVSPIVEAGLALDFVNLVYLKSFELVPLVSYHEVIRFEEDKPVFAGRISLGVRVFYHKPDSGGTGVYNGEPLAIHASTRSNFFSPNADGVDDTVEFDVTSNADEHGGAALWELRIYDPGRNVFFTEKGKGAIPKEYTWNGLSSKGEIVEGGCDYQYVWYAKAKDGADGFIPGIIKTDVMLKEEDGVLSFTLSSIQFGPNSAKFENLDEDQIKRNKELFDNVAQILNKYAEYTVTIEGHANNVSGTDEENIKELLPLSQARAETVKAELVSRGIAAERLIPVGRGSEKMITTNKEEAWKNRRVEFYMEKEE